MSTEKSPTLGQVQIQKSAEPPRRSLSREVRWALIGVLMLIFLVLFFFSLVPQDTFERLTGTGTLVGSVVDANNQPVAATVMIVKSNLEASTDAQGRFELRGVPAGERQLIVGLSVSAVEYRVQVVAGQVVDLGQLRAPLEDKGR